MDPYRALGVSSGATAAEIKKAFHKAAKKYHPDRNPGDKKAEDRFKEITEAYEVLTSGGDLASSGVFDVAGEYGLDDILSDLFSNPFKKERSGEDFPDLENYPEVLSIRIPEDIASQGGRIIVPYGPERLRVQIPPGTQSGQKLRIKGVAPRGEDIIVQVYLSK